MRRVFHYLPYVADVVRLRGNVVATLVVWVVDAFRTCWQQSIRVFATANAPPEGCLLKCKVDSACFEQEGAICPSIVEAFTIKEVLSWLKSLAFDNVIVESDYVIVILALSHPSSDFSEL
ncbi:hypothetical protein Gohar_024322, partial [Gossypium harknessii]|nr:hypothetical protein [Gossypium harknessii]